MIGAEALRTVQDTTLRMTGEVIGMGRNFWLAGLGTVATVEDELAGVFERLVEKGKHYEGVKVDVSGTVEGAKDSVIGVGRKVEETIQTTVADTLHRFGVPTREEIHSLIDRVEALTGKVEALAKK